MGIKTSGLMSLYKGAIFLIAIVCAHMTLAQDFEVGTEVYVGDYNGDAAFDLYLRAAPNLSSCMAIS